LRAIPTGKSATTKDYRLRGLQLLPIDIYDQYPKVITLIERYFNIKLCEFRQHTCNCNAAHKRHNSYIHTYIERNDHKTSSKTGIFLEIYAPHFTVAATHPAMRHLVNAYAYERKAGMVLFAGKTV